MNRRNFIKVGLAFFAAPVAIANALPEKPPPMAEVREVKVNPEFAEFQKAILRQLADSLQVPYELLTNDYRP